MMIPISTNYFHDAGLPRVSDSSSLSNTLVNNYQSEEEFEALFDDLREGRIPDVEFNERSKIFSETLPINFFNHITLENGIMGIDTFFTPSQRFVMKHIQKLLCEMKDNENYHKLLNYFACQLIPQDAFDTKLFLFCGEVTINRTKSIGIFNSNNQIEVYAKKQLFSSHQTFSVNNLPRQSKSWEQTRAEVENGISSPLIAVFRSFSALSSFEVLPVEVYSGFINYITSPDLMVTSQLLNNDIDGIEFALLTIFMHKNLHRRLLKYCIYHDVFSTDDPSHMMRMNTKEVKIIVDFLTNQIQSLIKPAINTIKIQIVQSLDIDFSLTDEETIKSVKNITDIFINGFIQILPTIPSSIRYVCCVINQACKLRFKSSAFKGIFMAFFFRVIFPVLCQPRPTDPPGLEVDIKKMAAFGKIMTSVFLADQSSLPQFAEIARANEENVNMIFDRLTDCTESYDMIDTPSFATACKMLDKIRFKCQKKASDLIFDYSRHSQILIHWLDLIANYE
ncbi:Ras GTPase activating protein ira2 [Tritrichomonas musculus]|uniref:Ras GTPase activating protein ira2 n=1 Tax=Tritrichomonas musculus TaxID=1915356 RepID=A0ABR2H798_9EUKA